MTHTWLWRGPGLLSVLVFVLPAYAQIVPDGTLGTQVNGVCSGVGGTCNITNGSIRGSNLFHSFQQFSLPNGDIANVQTLPAIQNVIVRVTGQGNNFISNINGTIQSTNPINFFLLNPNGITFGSGATLNIGGSFLATTAERMQFRDGSVLNVRDSSPLLTISVPVGLQMGQRPGTIQMQRSQFFAGITDDFTDFALVGGDIVLDRSVIIAPGRRIELGGLGENSSVDLRLDGNTLALNAPENGLRANMSITKQTVLLVAGSGGGYITITANNLSVDDSFLLAGIGAGIGSANSRAGDITLDAKGDITLRQDSIIGNSVLRDGIGDGGDIVLNARSLTLADGSNLFTSHSGVGNAGNLFITTQNNVSILGTNANGRPSAIFSQGLQGQGNSGSIQMNTQRLLLTGGEIRTSTNRLGAGGNISINASDSITVNGLVTRQLSPDLPPIVVVGSIKSEVLTDGNGNGGAISLSTGELLVTNGAQIATRTAGLGDAGNLAIAVRDRATLIGEAETSAGRLPSGAFSNVSTKAVGNGGTFTFTAGSLFVGNGARLDASTSGRGNAGNMTIAVRDTAIFDGEGSNGTNSGASTAVNTGAQGQGGDLVLSAGSLLVTNGAQLNADTFAQGNAGNLTLIVRDNAIFDGDGRDGDPSAAGSSVQSNAIGHGGNFRLSTGSLQVTNGAQLTTATLGRGNAGMLEMVAQDTIEVKGVGRDGGPSGIGSSVEPGAVGDAAAFSLSARRLQISDRAFIKSSSSGDGRAADLIINAQQIQLEDQGLIRANSRLGDGANIQLNVGQLLLMRRGSEISATAGLTGGGGNGGNITITAPNGFIIAVLKENSDIYANAFTGNGGRVAITAQGIYGLQFQPRLTPLSDITASSTFGLNGVVDLTTPDVDPSRGLVSLPTGLIDLATKIDQRCTARGPETANSFVISGRSGIPANPLDPLMQQGAVTELVPLPEEDETQLMADETTNLQPQSPPSGLPLTTEIVEAQGWMIDRDRTVHLVANARSPQPPTLTLPDCRMKLK